MAVNVPKPAAASRKKQNKSVIESKVKPLLRLHSLSINAVALLTVFYVLLLHLGALSLFTRGFLLKRTTLETRNACEPHSDSCTNGAKFDRVIILLVDALRYDFLFPVDPASAMYDAAHHNHLTVPATLSQSAPRHAIMYKSIADPPTTTLQRLKAITTGSLPTFIDAGSNFAGSRVDEDNWLDQAKRIGRRIAFMGDDTWLTIFPETLFAPNMSFPFDSFNVEDLDTVDAGVRHHLIPLLNKPVTDSDWDILIAHPLGLDHAGHRFGASHPQTTRKLQEVNLLIQDTVKRMADKDLLVVMGDHGMDAKGDHGGDSPEEVESALWLYSKTPLVPPNALDETAFGKAVTSSKTLRHILQESSLQTGVAEFFHLDATAHRTVQQISLVPTLCLLLGIPLPMNNLGTLIPELFLDDSTSRSASWSRSQTARLSVERLMHSANLNAHQILHYLESYAAHHGGADLAPYVPDLVAMYKTALACKSQEEAFVAFRAFTYATLQVTRNIWARFDPISMAAGLLILLGSALVTWRLHALSSSPGALWKAGSLRICLARGIMAIAGAVPLALLAWLAIHSFGSQALDFSQLCIFILCLTTEVAVTTYDLKSTTFGLESGDRKLEAWLAAVLLSLHAVGFASNSYILWEDWVVLYLQQIQPLFLLVGALRCQDAKLRKRILLFASLALVLNRVSGFSSVCREEQHPYCTATFYGSSGISISSPSAMAVALCAALFLPSAVGAFLDLSKSRQGWSAFFLRYSFRGMLVGGLSYWIADYLEHIGKYEGACQLYKTTLARMLLILPLLLATTFWSSSPLCIDVREERVSDETGASKTQVTVIGFANSIASSYLLVFLSIFGLLFLLFQPIGQVMSSLAIIALLALLEAIDAEKDASIISALLDQARDTGSTMDATRLSQIRPPSFLSICTLALWGYSLFFATGHQAVLSAIQWKTAFVGFPTLTYPFSPILVVLNTLGPFILSALALPLLVFWNVAPTLRGGSTLPVLSNLVTACLGFMLYHTVITLSSALFAAHLRRHLMVWKVFAPRFMLSAITLLAVDATILVGSIGWGGLGVLRKLANTFGTAWQ